MSARRGNINDVFPLDQKRVEEPNVSSHIVLPRLALILSVVIVGVVANRVALAQPLLREAPEDTREEQGEAPPAERAPRGGRMTAEEEQQLRVQQLMEFQRDQMLRDAAQKASSERMMRYALWTAIAVIGVTLLIAYSRNRTDEPALPPSNAGQGRGAPPIEPPTKMPTEKPHSSELNGD